MKKNSLKTEHVNCPYCYESNSYPWTSENGFTAVKCLACGIIYVNPRPVMTFVHEAVKTGVHSDVDHGRTAINRRLPSKVKRYKKIISSMFNDVWKSPKKISWLDVGAGYGEVV